MKQRERTGRYGNIQRRSSGRYRARVMSFELGTYDTIGEAEAAIEVFRGNKCPTCGQKMERPNGQNKI